MLTTRIHNLHMIGLYKLRWTLHGNNNDARLNSKTSIPFTGQFRNTANLPYEHPRSNWYQMQVNIPVENNQGWVENYIMLIVQLLAYMFIVLWLFRLYLLIIPIKIDVQKSYSILRFRPSKLRRGQLQCRLVVKLIDKLRYSKAWCLQRRRVKLNWFNEVDWLSWTKIRRAKDNTKGEVQISKREKWTIK